MEMKLRISVIFAKIKIGDIASGSAYHRTIYQ